MLLKQEHCDRLEATWRLLQNKLRWHCHVLGANIWAAVCSAACKVLCLTSNLQFTMPLWCPAQLTIVLGQCSKKHLALQRFKSIMVQAQPMARPCVWANTPFFKLTNSTRTHNLHTEQALKSLSDNEHCPYVETLHAAVLQNKLQAGMRFVSHTHQEQKWWHSVCNPSPQKEEHIVRWCPQGPLGSTRYCHLVLQLTVMAGRCCLPHVCLSWGWGHGCNGVCKCSLELDELASVAVAENQISAIWLQGTCKAPLSPFSKPSARSRTVSSLPVRYS
jgi:hypothetical protein